MMPVAIIISFIDWNLSHCVCVAESVQYPWERTLTDPNKVPYYVKYACILYFRNIYV